jgi:hypothetical protein
MSSGDDRKQFCVILDFTERDVGELQDISRRLKPFIDFPISQRRLANHLASEPLVVATELSKEEAERTQQKLRDEEIPNRVEPVSELDGLSGHQSEESDEISDPEKEDESIESWDEVIPDLDAEDTEKTIAETKDDPSTAESELKKSLDLDVAPTGEPSSPSNKTDTERPSGSVPDRKDRSPNASERPDSDNRSQTRSQRAGDPDSSDEPVSAGAFTPAFLSLLAPGAGQIYLGDEKRGHQYALNAYKIYPWVQSIKDAYRGKKGEDSPERQASMGNLLSFFVIWYTSLVVILGAATFVIMPLLPTGEKSVAPTPHKDSNPAIAAALNHSSSDLRRAVKRAGRRANQLAERHKNASIHYTLDNRKRSRRLLRRLSQTCDAQKPELCVKMAKRLEALESQYSRLAREIEIWAKLRESNNFNPDEHDTVKEVIAEFLTKNQD